MTKYSFSSFPIWVLISILLLTACSNESGISTDVDAGSITIEATIGQMTKVEYPGINSTKFVADDTILVYGWIGSNTEIPAKRVVDSVPNVYDGTVWTPLKPMLWKNATDAHYFIGIYPEPKSVTSLTEAEFTLDPVNYKASDLLIATNLTGVKATDGPVNLTFEHVMAKLNVNLKFRNEFGGTPDVSSVTAGAYSNAKVNYLTKEVTTSGTAGEVIIPKAAEPVQGFEMSFTGLQIPQNDVNRISITIGNRVFVYTSAQEIPLESGKYTTLNLIVGKDIIELDGISVKDWAAGTTIGLEEAKEEIMDISKNFEDEVFREFCIANYDANQDGFIIEDEVAGVTSMDVSNKGIKSLAGIEYFTNLTTLNCSDNDLDYLDVSKNTNLKNLDCRNNYFESIYIKKGQTFDNLQTFCKFASSPIVVKVNGEDAYAIGESGILTFSALLPDNIETESLVWKWVSDAGTVNVSHKVSEHKDELTYTYDELKDICASENKYEIYAETPDGIRSNSVFFGLVGENPCVVFNACSPCYLNVNEKKTFHISTYKGSGSHTLNVKYSLYGEGCNYSSSNDDEISVSWNKPGDKQIKVTVTDNDDKIGNDILTVHVVEVTLIECPQ